MFTGTAIGKKNLRQFHLFIYSIYLLSIFDIGLAIHSFMPQGNIEVIIGIVIAVLVFGAFISLNLFRAAALSQEALRVELPQYGSIPSTESSVSVV